MEGRIGIWMEGWFVEGRMKDRGKDEGMDERKGKDEGIGGRVGKWMKRWERCIRMRGR